MESTALVKGFSILEALASLGGEAGLAPLAALAGVTKPSAHRILGTLAGLGYVQRRSGGVYYLTGRLALVARGFERAELMDAAEALLQQLNQQTGETVNLGMLRQEIVVYLRVLESQHPLRRVANPDESDPFYSTALGRAIVAHLPEPQRELLLTTTKFEARTPQTVIDPNELRRTLDEVRQQGYAMEVDQTDLGVTCIGAPIMHGDQVLAAVSLSVPTVRSDPRQDELVRAVRQTAAAIGAELTHSTGVA